MVIEKQAQLLIQEPLIRNMARKQIVLRIEVDTLKAIEKWAADEFRSVNGQLEWMLHESLKQQKRVPKKSLSQDKESNKTS